MVPRFSPLKGSMFDLEMLWFGQATNRVWVVLSWEWQPQDLLCAQGRGDIGSFRCDFLRPSTQQHLLSSGYQALFQP